MKDFSIVRLSWHYFPQTTDDVVRDNIEHMNRLEGFNVIIICCSSVKQAEYWQSRLENGKGSVLPNDCIVLSVEEDWEGGAGNGELPSL